MLQLNLRIWFLLGRSLSEPPLTHPNHLPNAIRIHSVSYHIFIPPHIVSFLTINRYYAVLSRSQQIASLRAQLAVPSLFQQACKLFVLVILTNSLALVPPGIYRHLLPQSMMILENVLTHVSNALERRLTHVSPNFNTKYSITIWKIKVYSLVSQVSFYFSIRSHTATCAYPITRTATTHPTHN